MNSVEKNISRKGMNTGKSYRPRIKFKKIYMVARGACVSIVIIGMVTVTFVRAIFPYTRPCTPRYLVQF